MQVRKVILDCVEIPYFATAVLLLAVEAKYDFKVLIENPEIEPPLVGIDLWIRYLLYPFLAATSLLFIRFWLQKRWFEVGVQLLLGGCYVAIVVARLYGPTPYYLCSLIMVIPPLVLNGVLLLRAVRRLPSSFRDLSLPGDHEQGPTGSQETPDTAPDISPHSKP